MSPVTTSGPQLSPCLGTHANMKTLPALSLLSVLTVIILLSVFTVFEKVKRKQIEWNWKSGKIQLEFQCPTAYWPANFFSCCGIACFARCKFSYPQNLPLLAFFALIDT